MVLFKVWLQPLSNIAACKGLSVVSEHQSHYHDQHWAPLLHFAIIIFNIYYTITKSMQLNDHVKIKAKLCTHASFRGIGAHYWDCSCWFRNKGNKGTNQGEKPFKTALNNIICCFFLSDY